MAITHDKTVTDVNSLDAIPINTYYIIITTKTDIDVINKIIDKL